MHVQREGRIPSPAAEAEAGPRHRILQRYLLPAQARYTPLSYTSLAALPKLHPLASATPTFRPLPPPPHASAFSPPPRRLRSLLDRMQINVIALQGDMQQRARLKAVDRFIAQPQCVLLATDVAARGLDFPAVDYVVRPPAALTLAF